MPSISTRIYKVSRYSLWPPKLFNCKIHVSSPLSESSSADRSSSLCFRFRLQTQRCSRTWPLVSSADSSSSLRIIYVFLPPFFVLFKKALDHHQLHILLLHTNSIFNSTFRTRIRFATRSEYLDSNSASISSTWSTFESVQIIWAFKG